MGRWRSSFWDALSNAHRQIPGKIMANENMDDWKLGPKVIDETIRVTKRFLEEHPEEAKKIGMLKSVPVGTEVIKVGLDIIARFLGWNETRVRYSLERLHLIDEGVLDKEAVESMPMDRAARDLVDGNYKRICMSMGIERKVEGSYTIATPVSSRYPFPHTRRGSRWSPHLYGIYRTWPSRDC